MQNLRISIEGDSGPAAAAVFGVHGGTIGRSGGNTLVLADAERSVSRLHARVECRDGQFVLINMGINPVISNGAVLATAEESPLASGESVRIGRFTLLVQAVDAQAEPAATAAAQEDDALFDDMTGLPLARRGAAWASDFDVFHDSSKSSLKGSNAEQAWLTSLLRGMGCDVPQPPVPLTPEQAGTLMRTAMNDTMRTWMAHCSPAVQQAWFSNFEDAFLKASLAASVEAKAEPPSRR